MDNYLKCKVCGKGISINEVAGYDDIDDVYCEICACKLDKENIND